MTQQNELRTRAEIDQEYTSTCLRYADLKAKTRVAYASLKQADADIADLYEKLNELLNEHAAPVSNPPTNASNEEPVIVTDHFIPEGQ